MIDEKKFFKLCKIVGIAEIAKRLGVVPTTVYNWSSSKTIPPIKWIKVNEFMKDFEKNNKQLLKKRLKEYDKKNK